MAKELEVEVWTSRCGYGGIEESLVTKRVTIGPVDTQIEAIYMLSSKSSLE
jgi:hypothetical protein